MPENNPSMPFLGADKPTYEVDVIGDILGNRTLNRLFYQHVAPGVMPVSLVQSMVDIWTFLATQWCACASINWALAGVRMRRIDVYGLPPQIATSGTVGAFGAPVQGTQGATVPPQDCVVFKRQTNLIGKKARGRIYFSGLAEDDHTAGQVAIAAFARFDALRTRLETAVVMTEGHTLQPMHVHYTHVPPATVNATGLPVLNWSYDVIVRTQRRRQIGRGV